MATRDIIRIDEEKCQGCGRCVNACQNGALALVEGKARLVGEIHCDGMGACLGDCPHGALTIETVDAAHYRGPAAGHPGHGGGMPAGGCPGTRARALKPQGAKRSVASAGDVPSALAHWPIQLRLASPSNPAYRDSHLLVAADCTAFALGAFHPRLLEGRSLVIACPKLDDQSGYVEKLTAIFDQARPRSVTVARMEVPCCRGLIALVERALEGAEYRPEVSEVVVGLEGGMRGEAAGVGGNDAVAAPAASLATEHGEAGCPLGDLFADRPA